MGRPKVDDKRRSVASVYANTVELAIIAGLADRWMVSRNEAVVRACLRVSEVEKELAATQLREGGGLPGWQVDHDAQGWALEGRGGLVASVFPLSSIPRLWAWEVGIVSEVHSWGPVTSYHAEGGGLDGCRQAMAAAERALKEQGG